MGTELKKLPARTVVEWPFEGAYERAEKCRVFLLTAGLITGEEDRNIRRRMDRISVKRYRLGARFKTQQEATEVRSEDNGRSSVEANPVADPS